MQPTNTKKRRLEALSKQKSSAFNVASQLVGQQRARAAGSSKSPSVAAAAATAAAAAAPTVTVSLSLGDSLSQSQAGVSNNQHRAPHFPYTSLADSQSASRVASRLQLPAQTACRGNLEDALERLMQPHMPFHVAQSKIAARLATDKAVVLVNPTGRINLAKPSSSTKGQRQLLATKLLPRAKRMQLAALPKSGIDYEAMLALHDLWCKYVSGVLTSASPENVERLLNVIDWHGALIRVVASKNPIYLHRVGVVAKATHSTFVLVSDDGRSSTVPLKGSSFECSIECGRIVHVTLSGDSSNTLNCAEKID